MAKPHSATGPVVLILFGGFLAFFVPGLGALAGGLMVLVGAILLFVRMAAGAVNTLADANDGSMRKCPFCAESIKVEATVCRYCNRDLP